MPATKAQLCCCHLCTESEGGSQGRLIPRGQLTAHRKRAEADLAARKAHENSQLEDEPGAEFIEEVTSKIFSLTLTNDSNPHPSRCFTSRNEIQETQRSANVGAAQIPLVAIMEGLDRLENDSRSSVMNQDASKVRENTGDDLTGEGQPPRPAISKRERNTLTTKALASLNHIEQHGQR
ncbi:hypothetical protein HYPSUDRAFT_209991 [Hypholoma sublateritium FD-334 SS-4]|uniref:Uncharacterized protein n=1 Tax=Hypholoma sublateritium (strain FD-334 SS-4) TaxID=945553 RepID=A0A0D2LQ32_HYPSF|nr:hypothetical protein HYPSUDRAFT_209991 [Hypholoma sublateritium FD-334 SS-4]